MALRRAIMLFIKPRMAARQPGAAATIATITVSDIVIDLHDLQGLFPDVVITLVAQVIEVVFDLLEPDLGFLGAYISTVDLPDLVAHDSARRKQEYRAHRSES